MPNYDNSKLYKIWSPSTELVYYGSTTQPLSKRLWGHKGKYAMWVKNESKDFTSSFAILKFDDAKIELVKLCPCATKEELHKEEGDLIRSNDCVNMCVPGQTYKEWAELNKDKLKTYSKVWNDTNREAQNKKKSERYHENKEAINEKRAAAYKANPEPMKTYQAGYRAANSDLIHARKNKPFTCSCGGDYTNDNKARHLKSKKHCDFLATGKKWEVKKVNDVITCVCGGTYQVGQLSKKTKHEKTKKHLSYKA